MAARIEERSRGLPSRVVQPWILPGVTEDPITEAGAAWPPVFQADDAGYYGDPASATRENGVRILDCVAAALAHFLDRYAATALRVGRGMTGPEISAAVRGPAAP